MKQKASLFLKKSIIINPPLHSEPRLSILRFLSSGQQDLLVIFIFSTFYMFLDIVPFGKAFRKIFPGNHLCVIPEKIELRLIGISKGLGSYQDQFFGVGSDIDRVREEYFTLTQ